MKRSNFLLTGAVVFALAFCFTSCSKDDDKDVKTTTQSQNGGNSSSSDNQTPTNNNGSSSTDNNGSSSTDNNGSTLKVPEDCIGGVFSVSANKKVFFSKGNLQYDADNQKFMLAEHQWDFIGENGGNISSTTGIRDLFGWGTWLEGANPMLSSDNPSEYSWDETKKAVIGEDWYALSNDEWAYLINNRGTEKYGIASVNEVNGLVLLPDDFKLPEGVSFDPAVAKSNVDFKEINEFSSGDWSKMESAGAIFLPAANDRDVLDASGDGRSGNYWSSTPSDSDYAYYFEIAWWKPNVKNFRRCLGHSVRLVKVL